MINNRQGGRRRGRGGQRNQSLGGQPGGNRQDNRQRGNAAQLLEKYKSLARDSQLSGDRVQSEYYLQFADHYFRVLGESRARFEDQRRPRDDEFDDEGDEEFADSMAEEAAESGDGEERPERREPRGRGDRDRGERTEGPERPRRFQREERGARGQPDYNGAERGESAEQRIAMDVLPPAIGRDEIAGSEEAAEDAPRPRRRARKPRAQDGEGEVAPAA